MNTGDWRTRLAARERAALDIPDYRRAAVLVGLTAEPAPRVLLTVRTLHLPSHRGQISFPGGSLEPGEGPVEGALREAREEVGLDPEGVEVLGLLDDVWTPQGFQVTPVLGVFPPEAALSPSEGEVAELLLVPLAELRALAPRRETRPLPPSVRLPVGVERGEVVHYDWRGYDIWGMTGRVIEGLLGLV